MVSEKHRKRLERIKEHYAFIDGHIKRLQESIEAMSGFDVLLPAVIVGIRSKALSLLDKDDEGYSAKKEMIYLIEREIIGAWIIKHSNSAVGEGAGLALMAISPFAPELGKIMDRNILNLTWENTSAAWDRQLETYLEYAGK